MNDTTNQSIASQRLRTTANLRLPDTQHEHYKEFQEALSMLKVSVEQVWRFELEKIHEQRDQSGLHWQVPSIYACRSVLPIPSKPKIASRSDMLVVEQPTALTASPLIKEPSSKQIVKSTTASLFSKQKSAESNLSGGRKSKRRGFSDQMAKYGTKKALLHLKFRCAKHTHWQRSVKPTYDGWSNGFEEGTVVGSERGACSGATGSVGWLTAQGWTSPEPMQRKITVPMT